MINRITVKKDRLFLDGQHVFTVKCMTPKSYRLLGAVGTPYRGVDQYYTTMAAAAWAVKLKIRQQLTMGI